MMDNKPLAPTDELTITLQAQEWNVVMSALHEAPLPLRLTEPVKAKIIPQFTQQNMPGNGQVIMPRQPVN